MMGLHELEIGDVANISTMTAVNRLRARMHSFGIYSGERVKMLAKSLGGETFEIEVDGTRIAMRKSEAQTILIK